MAVAEGELLLVEYRAGLNAESERLFKYEQKCSHLDAYKLFTPQVGLRKVSYWLSHHTTRRP